MSLQRFNLGVTLALAAWLMQLSVFLTPIFSSQIGIGHGICAELAVLAAPVPESSAISPHQAVATADMSAMDMSEMDMASMAAMPAKSEQHAAHLSSPAAPDQVVDHHSHHSLCGFCLLFGHSVLPPTLLTASLLLTRILQAAVSQPLAYISRAIPASKTHHPQSRAPPLASVLL